MTRYAITGAAVLLLTTSAFAQGGLNGYGSDYHNGWSNQQAWTPPSQRLHKSQSSCGPDRGEPVWGPGNALLGYACVPEGANGS